MFSSYGDWWRRAGRWQQAGMQAVAATHARGERTWEPDMLPQVRMLALEIELRDAAIMAMLAACPDYDGDLNEFGEEPVERLIRIGVLPPQPWGPPVRR
jgi:hypothetical protein